MLNLESLSARLASDPDFRSAFAVNPQVCQQSLDELEREALNSLHSVLSLAPARLLGTLLGTSDSDVEGPPDWAVPPPLLARAPHG